jgi:hypothetical protein
MLGFHVEARIYRGGDPSCLAVVIIIIIIISSHHHHLPSHATFPSACARLAMHLVLGGLGRT